MSAQIEQMVHLVMDTLGYIGISLLMFLECVFPPIPSELIVPLAGFATAQGDYDFVWVCVAATIGSVVGAVVLYYAGKWAGGARLMRWTHSYGKWIGMSQRDITKAMTWFDQHGSAVVFFCRFVPGIRSLISIPAGMASMSILPFLLYTTIGSALWVIALAYGGRVLGENYELIGAYIDPIGNIVLVLVGVVIAGWLLNHVLRQRRRVTS